MEGLSGAAERVKAAPGILDCENFDCMIARQRQSFLSPSNARLFAPLVAKARQMPFAEARDYLKNLADLIEHHPGLADEHKQLMDLAEADYQLGRSPAVIAALNAGGNA